MNNLTLICFYVNPLRRYLLVNCILRDCYIFHNYGISSYAAREKFNY